MPQVGIVIDNEDGRGHRATSARYGSSDGGGRIDRRSLPERGRCTICAHHGQQKRHGLCIPAPNCSSCTVREAEGPRSTSIRSSLVPGIRTSAPSRRVESGRLARPVGYRSARGLVSALRQRNALRWHMTE